MMNAFCVDLEDGLHVNYARSSQGASGEDFPHTAVATYRLLDLLERNDILATFFIVTEVAERHGDLLRAIAERGHELACHTHSHTLLTTLNPAQLKEELSRSCSLLMDFTRGEPVRGFRAPSWSITRDNLWVLDILKEAGFVYDASMLPFGRFLFLRGMSDCPSVCHRLDNGMMEFPASSAAWLGMRIPFSLATFFRLMPYSQTRQMIRRFHTHAGAPVAMNIHPWDLDVEASLPETSALHRFLLRAGRHRVEYKLERLLSEFEFGRMIDVLEERQQK